MLNIGLLGLGTVGQGVLEILSKRKKELEEILNKKIIIKKILVKNIEKKRNIDLPKGIITDNFNDIIEDDKIQLIIEATSNLEDSYGYIKEGLNRGKHVVTANKAIVSKYFEELTALALENKVAFLYEASVAGGIPVLKPLKEHIPLNRINEIQGILNGTCNYILTRMFKDDLDYDEVLKIAQNLGYAEANPAADVEGHDTLRKLRILSTLGLQVKVLEEDILLEGIDNIKSFDIEQIKKLNSVIKLIGEGKYYEDGFIAVVLPTIVTKDSYFSTVNEAFNSVAFKGDNVGELKFYGPGAGKLPTANAILTDVLDIGLNTYRNNNPLRNKKLKNYNYSIKGKFYLRVSKLDWETGKGLEEITEEILGQGKYIGIKTKEVKLGKIYEILKSLNINKKEYFLGRFL
ncbi:homoserine dehydrogenase [Clostridium sp. Cult2]|uniref:homoserine dehydrogenase n=1 Tax=Clostridium sp. Cult2 TaxID=2079003 RepID=UPI001F01E892|nr:homoserine dehydrogenase [Clostridium sp. Cult2]MCF6465731.1 homoserine dehydrogenase [Clostridium sp. Cult2]